MSPIHIAVTIGLILLCGLGGAVAALTPVPLPFMIGALLTSGVVAMFAHQHLPQSYRFPTPVREVFIALIGLMIGAQVTADLLAQIPAIGLSLLALTLFTGLAHLSNYQIFRRFGGYDRPTAFFAGTPGGLLESLAMGEEAGADLQILTMQQFLRIILVITLLPLGLSVWYGTPVGSASGVELTAHPVDLSSALIASSVGFAGYWLGRALRLPARQLTGPLIAAAAVSGSGLVDLALPDWSVNLAQVVIGTALGLRFTGFRGATLLRAVWLSFLSVAAMLSIGLVFALGVAMATGMSFDILLISYAPGGVTEMALVALSLNANPALVTVQHIYRIFLTVIGMGLAARWMGLRPKT